MTEPGVRPDLSALRRRHFCVVATPRSGSTYVCVLLDRVPGVICHRELFHRDKPFYSFPLPPDVPTTREEREKDPLAFLSTVERQTFASPAQPYAFGFKLFTVHKREVLKHVAWDPRYDIVLLGRANRLAQYSSLLIARETRTFEVRKGDPRPSARIVFEPRAFMEFVEKHDTALASFEEQLRRSGKSCFRLDYDQISDEDTVARLLDFLGLEFSGSVRELIAEVPLLKQNSSRIRERFVNEAEVERAMRQLGREDWLVEWIPAGPAGNAGRAVEAGPVPQ